MIQHLENTSELGLSLTDVLEVCYHSVSEFIWYADQNFFVLRKTVLSNDLLTLSPYWFSLLSLIAILYSPAGAYR